MHETMALPGTAFIFGLSPQGALLVLAVAFGPPALFAAAIAGAKRYRKEPGYALRRAFLWGATGAAFIALIVNVSLSHGFARPYVRTDTQLALVTAIVIAPFVEETAKVFGLKLVKREADEPVDGLIYGALVGLGFSATENLLYETSALFESGVGAWVFTAIGRTFSSSFLHAVASALAGYGVARMWHKGGTILSALPWWFLAVLIHSGFNFVASFGGYFGLLGIVPLFVFAIWGFSKVKSRVTALSLVAPHDTWHHVGKHREIESPPPAGRPYEPPVRYKRLGGRHPSQVERDEKEK